jgi:hypothetical protein
MTLANWPIVLVEFVVETAYKAALGVPILAVRSWWRCCWAWMSARSSAKNW